MREEVLELLMPFCEKNAVIHVDFELKRKKGLGFIDGNGAEVLIRSGSDIKEKDMIIAGEIARVKGSLGNGLEKYEVFGGWSVEKEGNYVSITAVDAGVLEGNLESKISQFPFEDDQYVSWFHAKQLVV